MTVIKNVEKYFDIGPELLHTIVTISQWTYRHQAARSITGFVLQ